MNKVSTVLLTTLLVSSTSWGKVITNPTQKESIAIDILNQLEQKQLTCGTPSKDLTEDLAGAVISEFEDITAETGEFEFTLETSSSVDRRVVVFKTQGNEEGDRQIEFVFSSRDNKNIDGVKVTGGNLKKAFINKGTLTEPKLVEALTLRVKVAVYCEVK